MFRTEVLEKKKVAPFSSESPTLCLPRSHHRAYSLHSVYACVMCLSVCVVLCVLCCVCYYVCVCGMLCVLWYAVCVGGRESDACNPRWFRKLENIYSYDWSYLQRLTEHSEPKHVGIEKLNDWRENCWADEWVAGWMLGVLCPVPPVLCGKLAQCGKIHEDLLQ